MAGSSSGQFFSLIRQRSLRLLKVSELSWFGSQQLILVSLVLCLLSSGGDRLVSFLTPSLNHSTPWTRSQLSGYCTTNIKKFSIIITS